MANVPLNGPCLKCREKSTNEEHLLFDLSNCSFEERTEFIMSLLTSHHTHGVVIDVDMKNRELEADVCVSWDAEYERFAQKVIKRIEMLNASK